jgi:hypothetical protein
LTVTDDGKAASYQADRALENRFRIVVVDDHHVVRAGLRMVLSESP